MAQGDVTPRNFFLNEQHELTRGEKEGGGSIPKYAPIDWVDKGMRIQGTLRSVRERVAQLSDPTKDRHYYVLAKPEPTLRKLSVNREKAPDGTFEEHTEFSGKDSRVFTRLGIDLLRVADDGSALVHMTPERADQLESTARNLAEAGVRERVRWATLDSFQLVPLHLRIDEGWLNSIASHSPTDTIIELQPLLTRTEIDKVMRAIVDTVQINAPRGQSIRGSGADFSGRQWLRAALSGNSLRLIAQSFDSVQSLHSPLISEVSGTGVPVGGIASYASGPGTTSTFSAPPTVAIVDTGIPVNHASLSRYRRNAGYTAPMNQGGIGQHGSFVASRVVFGDAASPGANQPPAPTLNFYDVNLALGPNQIDAKELLTALGAVSRTTGDIRVFNLSFDCDPLPRLEPVKRQEYLYLAQDLDNFIFESDALVVVSAGNTPTGVVPEPPYPNHTALPVWHLGAFASSFNALTCGSYVSQPSAVGLVKQIGWPSPFCRVGPGVAGAPKPDFSAPGGNGTANYGFAPGLGVWGLNANGNWQEKAGTSYAAPLLAREAAMAFRALESVCAPGTRPFAATVKSFLALTATPPAATPNIKSLAERTLGYGTASADRLSRPSPNSAVLVWQGVLEDKDDLARIQIPVPRDWLNSASSPRLRVVISADVPVNAAASQIWASRRIVATLRPSLTSSVRRNRHPMNQNYTLTSRTYDLSKARKEDLKSDIWILELSYEEAADYLPAMRFTSEQRVAFAAELLDEESTGPGLQAALQAMSFTATMTNLSVAKVETQVPVMVAYEEDWS